MASLSQLLHEEAGLEAQPSDVEAQPSRFQRFKDFYHYTDPETGERKFSKKRALITGLGIAGTALAGKALYKGGYKGGYQHGLTYGYNEGRRSVLGDKLDVQVVPPVHGN